jgi:hypothetical protein
MFDQMNAGSLGNPLIDTAWTTLEAANDLGDGATIEVCRRVIDATLRGVAPANSDVNIIFDFFG